MICISVKALGGSARYSSASEVMFIAFLRRLRAPRSKTAERFIDFMSKISQIKGIIFDLDGVLVDTEELHYLAWVKVLKPLGVNFSKEEFCAFAGKQISLVSKELIKKYSLNIATEKLVSQRKKMAFEIFKNNDVKMMPYAKQAVSFFAKENKIKLGLATGSFKKMALIKLKKTDFYNFFSAIITGDDVKRGKPFPDIYLLAAKKMKMRPKNCLALEDTQFGVESAKSAGLICFAIPSKYSRKQNFSRADKVFKNLKEAIGYIKLCLI